MQNLVEKVNTIFRNVPQRWQFDVVDMAPMKEDAFVSYVLDEFDRSGKVDIHYGIVEVVGEGKEAINIIGMYDAKRSLNELVINRIAFNPAGTPDFYLGRLELDEPVALSQLTETKLYK